MKTMNRFAFALALTLISSASADRDVSGGTYSGWWGCNAQSATYNAINYFDDNTTSYCVRTGDHYTLFVHFER